MGKKMLLLICAFLSVMILARVQTAEAAISTMAVYPASITVDQPGQLFTANITLANAPVMTQYIINNITWNPAIIELQGTSEDIVDGTGYFMPAGIFIFEIGVQPGRIEQVTNALLAGTVTGGGTLFTIKFRAKAVGTTQIEIQEGILLNGLTVADVLSPNDGTVAGTVTVIPEFPMSLLLPSLLGATAIAFIAKTILSRKRRDIKIP